MARLDVRQEAVIRALTYSGPLSPRQLREETGLAHRPLMAAVHRLERAFVVCEDQTDSAWDRPLHLVEREFPDLWQQAPDPEAAAAEVLARLLHTQVFATTAQLAAGSGLGKRVVGSTITTMERSARVEAVTMDGLEGWQQSGDRPTAGDVGLVRVLHLRDPLVRPRLDELALQYDGREVLQYLLIGDEIHGAACGHWRIKAHDVEDVIIDDAHVADWREDTLEAVRRRYPAPKQHVLACNGEPL